MHCKVALIKKQYSMKPDDENKTPDPNAAWQGVCAGHLQQLERMLRYLKHDEVHSALAARWKDEKAADLAAIQCDVNIKLPESNLIVVAGFESIALKNSTNRKIEEVQQALAAAARSFFKKYEIAMPTPPAGHEWLTLEPSAPAAKPKAKAKGRPKRMIRL